LTSKKAVTKFVCKQSVAVEMLEQEFTITVLDDKYSGFTLSKSTTVERTNPLELL
jgi:hypothetical protein